MDALWPLVQRRSNAFVDSSAQAGVKGLPERLLTQSQQNRDLNNMCMVIGVVVPCAIVWYDLWSYKPRTTILGANMSCNEQRGGV